MSSLLRTPHDHDRKRPVGRGLHHKGLICHLSLVIIIGAHVIMSLWQSIHWSVTIDEAAHLVSGMVVWDREEFDLYRVNPPLIRTIAAIPATVGGADLDLRKYSRKERRNEFHLTDDFIAINGANWFQWFILARVILIPVSVLGGVVCFLWARQLYGTLSGFCSIILWCFSPNILAWSSTIIPDVWSGALAITAGWAFWHWLRRSEWKIAMLAGIALGIAQLSKITLVVFFVLWPVIWIVWTLLSRCEKNYKNTQLLINKNWIHKTDVWHNQWLRIFSFREFTQLLVILLIAIYILNLGYLFEGSFRQLGTFHFRSQLFAGEDSFTDGNFGGNRFHGTILSDVPVPLPENYLIGIDLQRLDFERKMWSYLNGEWRLGGWWYYYLYAIFLKVPLSTIAIAAIALLTTLRSALRCYVLKDDIVLLLPAITIFILVSSQTGFNRHFRYLLPVFPFIFVWSSKVFSKSVSKYHVAFVLALLSLSYTVISTLRVFPHTLSYYNEMACGPDQGQRFLLGSNIDWGQDLFYLLEWQKRNPDAQPMVCSIYSLVKLEEYGIKSPKTQNTQTEWYAVSKNVLLGRGGRFKWLYEKYQPIARVGHSIYIYHIPGGRTKEESFLRE